MTIGAVDGCPLELCSNDAPTAESWKEAGSGPRTGAAGGPKLGQESGQDHAAGIR
jgi:hypothetical protein